MSMMVSFVLSFFPRDVLDEILNLIESVSEDFLTTLAFSLQSYLGYEYEYKHVLVIAYSQHKSKLRS